MNLLLMNGRFLQWNLCHLKVKILQLVDINWVIKMPPIFPVPNVKIGIITGIVN